MDHAHVRTSVAMPVAPAAAPRAPAPSGQPSVPRGDSEPRTYLIGDVAALTGLSAHALRAWERVGLLAPHRTAGGVRQYSEDDLARIRLIARTLDTQRLSRRTVAALLRSGELCPDAADYAPGQAGARRSRARANGARGGEDERSGADALSPTDAPPDRRLLQAISRVGNAVASGRPLHEVLEVVCHETCNAFGVSDAILWLVDPSPGAPPIGEARAPALVAAAGYGPHSAPAMRAAAQLRIPMDHLRFAAAQALRDRRGVIINAMDTSPAVHPELKALLPGAALLVAPLLSADGQAVGALALREALDLERFQADDLERAQLFATQAAIAIETARLHGEIRAAREQADAERARWQAAVDDMPQLVCTCDTQPRATYSNPALERLLERPPDYEVPPEDWSARFELLRPNGSGPLPADEMPFLRAMREDQPVRNIEILHRTPDGVERLVVWDAAPMRTPRGELLGAVAVGRDVTLERRRAQRERCLAAVTRAALNVSDPVEGAGHLARVLGALVGSIGLPVIGASLHLVDPETGTFRPTGVFAGTQATDVGVAAPLRSRLLGWQALAAGGRYSDELGAAPRWLTEARQREWMETGIRAWAALPLRVGETVMGALALELGAPHVWDEDERAWIMACADVIALAVRNDQLFVSERHRSEVLQAVLEGVDSGVTMTSRDGHMMIRNKIAVELTQRDVSQGTLKQNAAAYRLRDANTGVPIPVEQSPVARALRGEYVRDALLLMRNGNGEDRVMLSSSVPVRDSAQCVVAAVTTFRDVTTQTRRARLMERLSKRLGASLKPAEEMQVLADALVDLGGLDTASVYEAAPDGQSLHLLAERDHPTHITALIQHVSAEATSLSARVLRTGMPQVVQSIDDLKYAGYQLTHELAAGLEAGSLAALPLLARGRVVGVLVVTARRVEAFPKEEVALLQDLSARAGLALDNARLYETVHRTAAELNAIFEAMAEGVRVCDASGRIVRVNRAGAAFLGVPREQTLQTMDEYTTVNDPRWPDGRAIPPEEMPLERALRGESGSDFELILRQADTGKDIWLRSSYAPILDEATGTIVGAVAVARDETHVRALEQVREQFLAIIAHELKTPLTSLLGYVQAARRKQSHRVRGAPSPDGQAPTAAAAPWSHDMGELLGRIERQTVRLDRLLNDLLNVARVQQGRLEYCWSIGDLSGAVAEAVDEQRTSHADRRIDLMTPDEPLIVRLDADRIVQVVANLISNALKYSRPDRPVSVSVSADDGAGSGRAAVVRVRDEGTGIPAEHHTRLFERFYRVPGVEVQSGSGIGLGVGLYVAKTIVERHHGDIWVESEPGRGSTFAFSVPLTDARGD